MNWLKSVCVLKTPAEVSRLYCAVFASADEVLWFFANLPWSTTNCKINLELKWWYWWCMSFLSCHFFFLHELEYTINMPSPMSLSCFCLNEINIWFFAAFVLGFHDILLSWPADPSTALESSILLRISVSDSWRLHDIKGRLYWFHGIFLESVYEKLYIW